MSENGNIEAKDKSVEELEQQLDSMQIADRFAPAEPEPKPEEKKPEEKPIPDKKGEEQGDRLPKTGDENPDKKTGDVDDDEKENGQPLKNEDYARMRIRLKEEREARQAVEKRLKKIEESFSRTQERNPTDTPSPSMVFGALRQAIFDESLEAAKASEIEGAARHFVNNMAPDEILSVIEEARRGGFGEASRDIEHLAIQELPIAQTRFSKRMTEAATARQSAEASQSKTAESLAKMAETFPDLKKDESEFAKYVTRWRDDNLYRTDADGKIVPVGPLFDLLRSNPTWPEVIIPIIHRDFRLSQLDAANEQARQKEKELESKRSPGRSGADLGTRAKSKDSERIEAELEALGMVGG